MQKLLKILSNLLTILLLALSLPLQVNASIEDNDDPVHRDQAKSGLSVEIVAFDMTDGYRLNDHFVVKPGHTYQFIAKVENASEELLHSPRVNITLPEKISLGETVTVVATLTSALDVQIVSNSCELEYKLLDEDTTTILQPDVTPQINLNYIKESGHILRTFKSGNTTHEETFNIDEEALFVAHEGYSIDYLNRETGPYVASIYVQASQSYYFATPKLNVDRVVVILVTLIIGMFIGAVAGAMVVMHKNLQTTEAYIIEDEAEDDMENEDAEVEEAEKLEEEKADVGEKN